MHFVPSNAYHSRFKFIFCPTGCSEFSNLALLRRSEGLAKSALKGSEPTLSDVGGSKHRVAKIFMKACEKGEDRRFDRSELFFMALQQLKVTSTSTRCVVLGTH